MNDFSDARTHSLLSLLGAKRRLLTLAKLIGPEGFCSYGTISEIAAIEAELAYRALPRRADLVVPALDTFVHSFAAYASADIAA